MSFAATYAYATYFGPKTLIQTNADKDNCRQGNVLEGVGRQARFKVLSTCKKVHYMEGTKEDDGDYQFNLSLDQPYKRLLNEKNNEVNGVCLL
jgi:hypothetical protein